MRRSAVLYLPLQLVFPATYRGARYLNGKEPKSCLGQVFNSKLGSFATEYNKCIATLRATSRVANSFHVKSG
jgi:hypothetical protein